jgi:hypothetical protein
LLIPKLAQDLLPYLFLHLGHGVPERFLKISHSRSPRTKENNLSKKGNDGPYYSRHQEPAKDREGDSGHNCTMRTEGIVPPECHVQREAHVTAGLNKDSSKGKKQPPNQRDSYRKCLCPPAGRIVRFLRPTRQRHKSRLHLPFVPCRTNVAVQLTYLTIFKG